MTINLVYVRDFGAVGDGMTDDTAAISAAIAAAAMTTPSSTRPASVWFDALEYAISSTLSLGNGSNSQFSTINSIELRGAGAPDQRLVAGPSIRATGTRLKWIGGSGGTMVQIAGPCQGFSLHGIALNGNGLANICLNLVSANRTTLINVTLSDFLTIGLQSGTVSVASVASTIEDIGCEGLFSDGLRITANANTTGISLDGWTGSASSDGQDTTRASFRNTYLVVSLADGTGIRLAFCDQVLFDGLYMTGGGTPNGLAASLRVAAIATVQSGFAFPQNVKAAGDTDIGQNLPIVVTGIPGGGNFLDRMTLLDNQIIPRDPVTRYITYSAFDPGNFPKGGFWSWGGASPPTDRCLEEQDYKSYVCCCKARQHGTPAIYWERLSH